MLNAGFLCFTNITYQALTNFIGKYFLDSLFDFIILKFVYKRLKVHSTKLSNIMLLPWWFERLRNFHFKKLRDNFRVSSDSFSGKFSKEVCQCVEEIFIWRNWKLVSDVENGRPEFFGHEHRLHETVHVASVAQVHQTSITICSFDIKLLETTVLLLRKVGFPEDCLMNFIMNVEKLRLIFVYFLKVD